MALLPRFLGDLHPANASEGSRGQEEEKKGERQGDDEAVERPHTPASLITSVPPMPSSSSSSSSGTHAHAHRLKCGGPPLPPPPPPPPPRLSLALVAFCWNRLASSNAFPFGRIEGFPAPFSTEVEAE